MLLAGDARVRFVPEMSAALRAAGRRLVALSDQPTGGAVSTVLAGGSADSHAVREELGEQAFEVLRQAEVLLMDGSSVSSPFCGNRIGDRMLFSDPDVEEDEQYPHYLDPLWEAELLVRLMLSRTGERALDIGCGCGVLSLVLSGDYRQVVGVDVNPRAIEVSALNAALNGVTNLELVEGDMFEAIEGKFDRIVFNSPTNEEGAVFRDLLEAGEGILEQFFLGLPQHLASGGLAEVNLAMNDYPHSAFTDRLAGWLGQDQAAIDVLILTSERAERADGHLWKRGWLLAMPGTGKIVERDWPYHELESDPSAALSQAIEGFLAAVTG